MKTFGSRTEVKHGTALKTTGGLKSADLIYVGPRIVSKKASKAAVKNPGLKKWRSAVTSAKKALGLPKKGTMTLVTGKLLKKTRALYKKK